MLGQDGWSVGGQAGAGGDSELSLVDSSGWREREMGNVSGPREGEDGEEGRARGGGRGYIG